MFIQQNMLKTKSKQEHTKYPKPYEQPHHYHQQQPSPKQVGLGNQEYTSIHSKNCTAGYKR